MFAPLPGKSVTLKDDDWGLFCYEHPDVPATHRICSESDSFGSEFYNMCDQCWAEHLQNKEDIKNDPERWETCKCGNREPSLIAYRDMDEGMHGPVYHHCSVCHEKWNQRIAEENAYYDRDYDDYEDYHDVAYEEDIPDDVDATPDIVQALRDQLTQFNIRGFTVAEDGYLYCTLHDRRKVKRFRRKLTAWFEKYTDAYTDPMIGFVDQDYSRDKLNAGEHNLYLQVLVRKIGKARRFSLKATTC